jgi:hypothetical protein
MSSISQNTVGSLGEQLFNQLLRQRARLGATTLYT